MTWNCVKCNRPTTAELTPTVIEHYREGYCIGCKKQGWFLSAVKAEQYPMQGQARHTDPDTSKAAASRIRPGSAKAALLRAHSAYPNGMTDEEAAKAAQLPLHSEYATRCSELERAGYLENTDQVRTGSSGMSRVVRRITALGLASLEKAA